MVSKMVNSAGARYEQVGVMALRRPDGSFCESTPIYKALDDREAAAADQTAIDLASIFLAKMKEVGAVQDAIRKRRGAL